MPKTTSKTKEISKGICTYCKGAFDKSKMTQHLKHCKLRTASLKVANTEDGEKTKLFHLVVEGRDHPMYWMHLEIPADQTLLDLDEFLREIWVECCGHLSEFRIGKVSYLSQTEDMDWGFGGPIVVTEEDDEDETDEEEEDNSEADDLVPDEIEAELTNLSPAEVVTRITDLLAQEFQTDLLSLSPAEFQAKFTDFLNTKLGGSFPPELLSQLSKMAPLLQSGLLLDLATEVFEEEEEEEEQDMNVDLGEVLKVGQKFSYEYDFGSTTELALRVVAEREGVVNEDDDEDPIQVMARNEPPVIPCRVCGKPASKVVSGYFYAEDGALCETCAKSGEYNEEMLLPVVNSPRVGVCGYTGDAYEDDWEEEEEDETEEED